MATTTTLLLLLLLILLATSTSARPCKSLFFITSSYTLPSNPNPRYVTLFITSNPNPNPNPNPNRFFLIPKPFGGRIRDEHHPIRHVFHHSSSGKDQRASIEIVDNLSGGYGRVKASIKDRSKDIISVVGALLFGMGCGALTAATMYLLWALFAPNRFHFQDEDSDDDDDLYNPKKVGQPGYMVIPNKLVDHQELNKPVHGNGA